MPSERLSYDQAYQLLMSNIVTVDDVFSFMLALQCLIQRNMKNRRKLI